EAARLIVWIEEKVNELALLGPIDDRFHPPHTSMHVGRVNGGIAPNVIADHVQFDWDIRVIPGNSVEKLLEEFSAFCSERTKELQDRFPDFQITTTMEHPPVPPLDTSADSKFLLKVQQWSGFDDFSTVAYAAE